MKHDEASKFALEIAAKQTHIPEDVIPRAELYYVWLRRRDPLEGSEAPPPERGRRHARSEKPVA